ncbi:MAG TPA: multidrug transporter [Pseudomonadales bacterium]
MEFSWIAICIVAAGVLSLVLSGYLLMRGQWFQQWMRGTIGLFLAAIAVILVLVAVNFYGFHQLTSEKPIATLSLERLENQVYKVKLEEPNGQISSYELHGDLWQLDARIIKWWGVLSAMGLKPGYKLDRIQGRYIAIEDERSKSRTVYSLAESRFGVDIWKALQNNSLWLPLIDTSYGSATFVPMKDGAIYTVNLSPTGLLARPLNDVAKEAILNR